MFLSSSDDPLGKSMLVFCPDDCIFFIDLFPQGTMADKEPANEQAVDTVYVSLRTELNQVYSKITELEMEVSKHSLVITAIQPLDPSRRCYRMIGGILVERTVKEVLPSDLRYEEGLEDVIARLNVALEEGNHRFPDQI